ncbi:MAG: substrate-binding domain-containing protein [Chloroflexota bacterium]|nr:substrate-binding domain-containing protein [Chloroflexota bacterium]
MMSGNSLRSARLSRRSFLGGIAASAGATILAACGGSSNPTATSAPVTSATTASGTTGASVATRPATTGSAISSTAASTAANTASTSGTTVASTTAASSVTSGTAAAGTSSAASSTGFTLLPTPSATQFKGQSLQVIARQEYFKEVEGAFDAEVQKFAQLTGSKIENNRINEDTGQVVQKMDAAVKAGNGPDIAYFDRFVPELYQLGNIVDVSDVVGQISDAYGAPEDNVRINATVGGKYYGIPYSTQGAGYFARKDWLTEKNIKITDVKTFENLRDVALEISDPARNRYGWGMTVNQSGDGNGLIQGVINAYGGAGASDDGKKAIFNSPETVQAVTFLGDIYTNPKYKNMLPPGVQSWNDTGNNEAWLAGVIGITTNQFSLYAQSKATKNPVYDNTVVFPGVIGTSADRPLAFGNYSYFVIFKGAKNPDLAKALARYLVGGSALVNIVKPANGLILPAYKKVWESDPYYLNGDPVFSASRAVVEQPLPIATKTGLHFPQTPSPAWQQAYNSYILTDMMGQVIQKGVKPADAVKQASDRIVAAFNQLGIPQ